MNVFLAFFEHVLSLIHDDHAQKFQNLLEITNDYPYKNTITIKNLQWLAKEIYRHLHSLSPPIMNDVFQIREKVYNLKSFQLDSSNKKTVKF